MQPSERVTSLTPSSTLEITAKASALKAEGYDVIGLAAGQPDFNTPQHIIDAAFKAANEGATKYTPSGGLPQLKEDIAEKLHHDLHVSYDTNEIMVATGAKHALYTLFQALINPGDEVIIPAPYWVSYPEQVKLAGGRPVIVETTQESHFKMTTELLESAITAYTKAVIINSPSNPTGMIYDAEELQALGDICLKHDITIVSDEIYDQLIYGDSGHISITQLSKQLKEQTILINGVSKTYSMTGWRIGYAAGNATVIQAMTGLASHSTSNPTTLSQYGAMAALEGSQQPVEDMRQAFASRLDAAFDQLVSIPGITCLKPKGAFYLFPNVKEAAQTLGYGSVSEWATALLEKQKVALVPGSGFGSPNHVRISYAASLEQIEEALRRIKRFQNKGL